MNNIQSSNQDIRQLYQSDADSNTVKRYISLFFSNWYWFAFTMFISLTLVYGINRYSEQTYSVSSSLLIKDDKAGGNYSSDKAFFSGTDLFNKQQNLRNEIGILKSFSLNFRVIDSLKEFHIIYFGIGRRNIVESTLYKTCPFEVQCEEIGSQPEHEKIYITIISTKLYSVRINGDYDINTTGEFGKKFIQKGFNFTLKLKNPDQYNAKSINSNKYYFYFEKSENLANYYASILKVEPIDLDASLVRLSVSGPDSEQAADYLNMLMNLYIIQGIEVKNRIADSTMKFIDQQLMLISDSLKLAETKLETFRNANKIIDVNTEGTEIQKQIARFDEEKITLELQQKYYEYLNDYLNSKNESGDIVSPSIMGITDQLLTRLVEDLANWQKQKKQLEVNFSNNQTPIRYLEEGINTSKLTLSENVKNSLENINNNIIDVNKRISVVEQAVSKLPGTEIRMVSFQRAFDLNNTIYTFLLQKRAEAGIARASNVSDNRIIDRAEPFNSVLIKPKRKQNYLLALILGFFIPGFSIAVLYNFNNKIIDKEDIIKRTDVPVIGYISHNDSINEIPVNDNPGSVLAESFRSIRTSLRYLIKENDHPIISITSTISSEGKTFISINLAAIYAMLGKKVLLIGLDLRKPRIHRIFDISNSEGMSTFLSGNCDYDKVIKKTKIENLFYAVSGPVPPNPAELIEGSVMKSFIARIKNEFDLIIIDTPPVAIVSDALLLADYVDVNIFVVRQRYSSKNTLDLIEEFHKSERLKGIGIIINDISLSGYYGYGLRYGYSTGYGYSYGSNYHGEYTSRKYGYSDKEYGYYNK
jgi:tyrosine-protein kinase Etk/Wzc